MRLYDACLPACCNALDTMDVLLAKAAAHGAAIGTDTASLLQARLAPDMLPLTRQFQIACDNAKLACYRLAGLAAPSQPDTEATVAELQARVAATRTLLGALSPAQFADAEHRTIAFKAGGFPLQFTALDYLSRFALPNIYFHVTTAYAILRHAGVPLTKRDYLPPLLEYTPPATV